MTSPTTHTRVWCGAFLLAVLLHVLIVLMVTLGRPFATRAVPPPIAPIDVVFAPASAAPRDRPAPSFFTELPPDREGAAPEQAEFLSTVDSRARDLVPGGDEAMPRLEGESEAPHVRLDAGEEQAAPTAAQESPVDATQEPPHARTSPAEPTRPPVASRGEEPALVSSEPADRERAHAAERRELDHHARLPQLVPPPHRSTSLRPGADFHQVEMYRPQGDAAAVGSVSLNTVAWAYAPWLQEFSRRLQRSWLAPVAYYMGIIDGSTELEMEVARDGSLQRLQVLDAKGHDSLRQTSVAVLEALAPYRALPDDFPERSLILRIRLVYPPLRDRGRG